MRIILSLVFLLFTSYSFAGDIQNPFTGELQKITDIQTEDGTVKIYAPEIIKVTNGTLTDNGDGTASLAVSGLTVESDPTVDTSAEIVAIIGAGVYDASGAAAAVTPTTLSLVIGTNTQAYDADLTTYAGITPSANAQTLLGETFAQMQASMSIDDLITLSGVAEGSVNLATFTGSTIADNVTIKAGLQALETAVEGKQASLTFGIADTNKVQINAADVADNDYAKFTATGLEGRSYSEVLSDIGAQASDTDLTSWAEITPGTPTGTGTVVFNNSPTFADDIQLGLAGTTGILKLYSEQGATDYTASLYPNTAMTSAASFYLPVDEPAAQSFVSMSTGGVMSFVAPNAGTNIANDLEEEVTEGSLADSTIVSADIKNGEIVSADLSGTAGITLAQTAMTAGRSLTISTNDIAADAELYTDPKTVNIDQPVIGDIASFEAITDMTITRVQGIASGTSVVLNWKECDSAGLNCSTIESITADSDGTISTSIDNPTVEAGDMVVLELGTVTSATFVSTTLGFTKND